MFREAEKRYLQTTQKGNKSAIETNDCVVNNNLIYFKGRKGS